MDGRRRCRSAKFGRVRGAARAIERIYAITVSCIVRQARVIIRSHIGVSRCNDAILAGDAKFSLDMEAGFIGRIVGPRELQSRSCCLIFGE